LFAENTGTGQQMLHVFDFEAPATPVTAADCQAVDNILVTWWVNSYRHMCANSVRARRAVAVGRDQVEAATWEINMSTDGDRGATAVASQVSLCLKFAGNNIGRNRRGRHYAFPAASTDVIGGGVDRFNTTYVNALVTSFGSLVTDALAAGYPLRVASNVRAALYPVSHVVAVDDLFDSMRRRSSGRGR
jgi:hypothetical protein